MKVTKLLSALLAMLMLVAVIPANAFAANDEFSSPVIDYTGREDDYYKVISKKDYILAPGITESEIVLNNNDLSHRQVAHVVEVDMNSQYTEVVPSYKCMIPEVGKYGTQIMSEQAKWAEANGKLWAPEGWCKEDGTVNVVAAMNLSLSWYNSEYYTVEHPELIGEPLGYMILNGEIYKNSKLENPDGSFRSDAGAQTCVVINFDEKDGVARPEGMPKVEIRSITSAITGWEEQVIPANFGFLVKDGKNQYSKNHTSDPASRSFIGIKEDGTFVMVMNDGRQAPYSIGFNSYEMAEFMLSLGCVAAINGDGGGSSSFLSQRPGEELKVNCSPSDGAERATTGGILVISTAPNTGKFARASISAANDYYTPGSSVQFTALGSDYVGTPADVPAGAYWQLTDESMGTINQSGLFTSSGKEGKVTVQMVYEDSVVGEATITIVLPEIEFRNETIVIGYGESMTLPVEVTTNEGRNFVSYGSGDIVYTLSNNDLGTIFGDTFTACDESTGLTEGTITAVICGQTEKTISARIRFGKASEIAYDFEDGYFPIDTSKTGNIGGDDSEDTGEYIYGWHINDTRANGHFSYRNFTKKNYTPIGCDIPASLYLVDSTNGMVRNGKYAMGIDIDWTNVTASCHGQMDIHLPEFLDLTEATSVGFWMYLPAELITKTMCVDVVFGLVAGGTQRVSLALEKKLGTNNGIDNGGWFYFSWEVLDTYSTLQYIQIDSAYEAGEGNYNYYQDVTFYIDDITVDYSDATIDRENPYFTGMNIADEKAGDPAISGQTITNNTISLKAQAYENTAKVNATGLNRESAKVYVDGVLLNKGVSVTKTGLLTVEDLYLDDGVHTILMEISDYQGNVGNIVRKLVVNTEKSPVRLEVPTSDKLLPTGSIYWLNLVADNISLIESVTTTINLDYVNDWELEGMEVAYGFKAEYYINDHNDAVITFTRTGTEIADTNILAKLPVRIWMALSWMDDSGIRKDYISDDPAKQDKYYILTPHAMWYSDGTRDYRLVVSAEAGVVTYVNGNTATFSAKETVIQTEMNRYYTNKDRQNKWSFHIHTAGEPQNKAPTCTEAGYIGRVFCVGCSCGSVDNMGTECDTHAGCGSVIDWGETVPATGHSYDKNTNGFSTCEVCNETRYFIDGKYLTGWNEIDGKFYYFNRYGVVADGTVEIDGHTYKFVNRVLTTPAWEHDDIGLTAYWAGKLINGGWHVFNGNKYHFTGIYASTGVAKVALSTNLGWKYYVFDENGVWQSNKTGIVKANGEYYYTDKEADKDYNGDLYYAEDGICTYKGLVKVENSKADNGFDYYYFNSTFKAVKGRKYSVAASKTNGLLPSGVYLFNDDGTIDLEQENVLNGLKKEGEDGKEIRYYVNGEPTYAGVVEDPDNKGKFFYINSTKKAVIGPCKYGIAASKTNGLIPAGVYTIDENGHIDTTKESTKNGLHFNEGENKDEIRYYVNGVAVYQGLVRVENKDVKGGFDYYYINSTKKAVKDCKYSVPASKTNGFLPAGIYTFGLDGKMDLNATDTSKNGLKKEGEDGKEIRYYVNGEPTYAGVVEDPDNKGRFFYINSTKKAVIGPCKYGISASKTNGLIPAGIYTIDGNGYIDITGQAIKNGLYLNEGENKDEIRYYVNGEPTYAGVVEDDEGNRYYINSTKKAVIGPCKYGIAASKTNGLIPAGIYVIDKNGHIQVGQDLSLNGLHDGYWYVDGIKTYAGVVRWEGNLLYIKSDCKPVISGKFSIPASKTNGLIPAGIYNFKDGCIDENYVPKNGCIRDEDGEIRYYVNDTPIYKGVAIYEEDGAKYYVYINSSNTAVKNKKYNVPASKANGLVTPGIYQFNELGYMLDADGNVMVPETK